MPRSKRVPKTAETLAPVPDAILNQFAPGGHAHRPANHRNGSSAKTVLTDDGALPLAIPRDRHGTFTMVLIPTHQRRFTGFDDKILVL